MALPHINRNGMDQGFLHLWLYKAQAWITEVLADHDADSTHDTNVKTLLNNLRTFLLNRVISYPGFAIKSNFDVQNANRIDYVIAGTFYSLAAAQTFDTGTSQVIAADKWSAALLSVNTSSAAVVTWSATLNAATEAAAIAALPAVPANNLAIGYITVLTGSGVTWTAGTDALASGTGGTPATTTNYYNKADYAGSISAAVSTSPAAALTATDPVSSVIIDSPNL